MVNIAFLKLSYQFISGLGHGGGGHREVRPRGIRRVRRPRLRRARSAASSSRSPSWGMCSGGSVSTSEGSGGRGRGPRTRFEAWIYGRRRRVQRRASSAASMVLSRMKVLKALHTALHLVPRSSLSGLPMICETDVLKIILYACTMHCTMSSNVQCTVRPAYKGHRYEANYKILIG